ncbi:MAG: hypothetical protein ACI9JM_000913 [Halioglobus sp.]|jgi:hypothetical protein
MLKSKSSSTATFALLSLLCLSLFWGTTLHAQEERWFRVELMVFSHRGGESTERWEPTPRLGYPGAARFLVDPDTVEQNQVNFSGQSTVDEFGRQILTPLRGSANFLPSEIEPADIANDTDETVKIGSHLLQAEAVGRVANATDTTPQLLLPTPFQKLPNSLLEFRGKAAYMNRSGSYQMLFHESWVQPVIGKSDTLPIILDHSGDYGGWPKLQGSINLYLSRYLHLETNLWLNTSGEYLDSDWRMPPAPLGPLSVIIEEPLPLAIEPFEALSSPTVLATLEGENITLGNITSDKAAAASEDLETLPLEKLEPIYPYRHAVLLQQKRRMRSQEVHYIDHPMLGLVIKVTPLDEQDLEEMALAEEPELTPETAETGSP